MKLSQLESVRKIAEYGSITSAAQKLFVTQQALSDTLKLVESELGFIIFNRSKTGVAPTPEGEIFLRNVNEILSITNNWETLAVRQRNKKTETIVVQHLLRDIILFEHLKENIESNGNCIVKWDDDTLPNIIDRISVNDSCLAIFSFSPQSYVYSKVMRLKQSNKIALKPLVTEEEASMHIVIRSDDPLAMHEKINPTDLSGKQFIVHDGVVRTDFSRRITAATGQSPYVLPHSVSTVSALLQGNNRFTCVPKFIAEKNFLTKSGVCCCRPFHQDLDPGFNCYIMSNISNKTRLDVISDIIIHNCTTTT